MRQSQILDTWSFSSNLDIVPWIGQKLSMGAEFNSFPGTTSMSGCMENCQKYTAKSHCSPIYGTLFVRDRFVPLDLVPWIGGFSRHPNILVKPGKLLELCSNVLFFSNPGDNVKITAEISWSQDLRVSHLYFIKINLVSICLRFMFREL